jgi:hypothetical protein
MGVGKGFDSSHFGAAVWHYDKPDTLVIKILQLPERFGCIGLRIGNDYADRGIPSKGTEPGVDILLGESDGNF